MRETGRRMLEEITIRGLGVIESSTLELGPGLTVVTGETGAGKTMLVTALGLLLGGRAERGAVRTGARNARVEGVVDADGLPTLVAAVDAVGGEVEEHRVLLARNVGADGRSRAFLGGAAVPASTLSEAVDPLIAVHGQSDQHRLLHRGAQRAALDRYAGPDAADLIDHWRRDHLALSEVEAELTEVARTVRERRQEADRLRFALEEIAGVAPEPGEDVALATEESRLGFADTLRTAAEQARRALSDDDGGPDALGTTSSARTLLDSVREHDPEAAALADRLAEVSYLLSDLAADVASYADAVEVDPVRLAAVSERRAALTGLTRKYGDTLEEVLAWSGEAAVRLTDLDGTDDHLDALRQRRGELRARLAEVGAALSVVRTSAASGLADAVAAELAALAMPDARLEVAVTQQATEAPDQPGPGEPLAVDGRRLRYTATGLDEVEFRLAANAGAEARPLHKSASGGELSRVMLAVEVTLARSGTVPTFVFDEVDAGVGGKAAVEVGRRLARLAAGAQVLVVTHLPQVAAYADRHVVVAKSSDGVVTTSGLRVLDDADRVRELSRMLAGQEDSETARAHAEELLSTARSLR